jgi:hypothetical protein
LVQGLEVGLRRPEPTLKSNSEKTLATRGSALGGHREIVDPRPAADAMPMHSRVPSVDWQRLGPAARPVPICCLSAASS